MLQVAIITATVRVTLYTLVAINFVRQQLQTYTERDAKAVHPEYMSSHSCPLFLLSSTSSLFYVEIVSRYQQTTTNNTRTYIVEFHFIFLQFFL